MKTKLTIPLLFFCFSLSVFSQSRGIRYEFPLSGNTTTSNTNIFTYLNHSFYPSYSTVFEIANENMIQHQPYVKIGNNHFSLLTKYNSNLCLIGTKRIPIPVSNNSSTTDPFPNASYTGASNNNGGFALITHSYPHILRNYDSQGNLIFSKTISTPFYDNNLTWCRNGVLDITRPKIVYSLENGNIFVLFATRNYNVPNIAGARDITINVVEVSPIGNLVNSFKLSIPFLPFYSDPINTPDPIRHVFDLYTKDLVGDVKYVKGGNGVSSDRLWIALGLEYSISAIEYGGYCQASYFDNNPNLSAVAVISPQGNQADINIMLPQPYNGFNTPSPKLQVIKKATSAIPAEIMMLSIENNSPVIYNFNNHISSIPSNRFEFPLTLSNVIPSTRIDLKSFQNNILFSYGEYFGTFNTNTLGINLRKQVLTNTSTIIGFVDFMQKETTNKLYINYNNYLFPSPSVRNPSSTIIKQPMSSFNSTCMSSFDGNYTATMTTPTFYPLVTQLSPLTGITLTKDLSYFEFVQNDLVRFYNACLTCTSFKSDDEIIGDLDKQKIILYPNPTNSYFELSGDVMIEKVEVYSLLGQLVKSYEKQEQYSVSDITKGTYIVKITSTEGVSNKTLIVE
jgi:hypothetical protein